MSCCAPNKITSTAWGNKPAVEISSDVQSGVESHYGCNNPGNPCAIDMVPDPKMCPAPKSGIPEYTKKALSEIHPEILAKSYGCGTPIPEALEGAAILDMGCGTGRDVFVCSKLVGPKGKVVGVDMTAEQIQIAEQYIPYHENKFGYRNVEFKQGRLEDLDKIGYEPDTFDVIISNCVINLAPDKELLFQHAYSLLKPGGELYFSDAYVDGIIPDEIRNNALAWNECFSGCLRWSDFVTLVEKVGFLGPFICSSSDYKPQHPDLKPLLANLQFWSRTVRLIKPASAEVCGKTRLKYNGKIAETPEVFVFDYQHVFKVGEPQETTPEFFHAVKSSRYGKYFDCC